MSRANEVACSRAAHAMMTVSLSTFTLVDTPLPYPQAWAGLDDEWDVPVWAAAVAGNVDYVISENIRDFPPPDMQARHSFQGVRYLTGKAFLDELYGE